MANTDSTAVTPPTTTPAQPANKLAKFEPTPNKPVQQAAPAVDQKAVIVPADKTKPKAAKAAKKSAIAKAKPKKAPAAPKARVLKEDKGEGQFLDLGAGYKIAHKPGSAYSVFYKVVAEKGSFAEITTDLEAGKFDVNDKNDANKLLSKMLVPVDRLAGWCRAHNAWKEHAEKKTEVISKKARQGDRQAKELLKNRARCGDGRWSGNIAEMISTCVGYYNHRENKKGKPNKNVRKFQEARIVLRRFPLSPKAKQPSFVLMFPEKFIDAVKTAILVGRGVLEDAKK